ncbi:MAG: TonB family protein [Microscillaceae bacterium]|jgi:protein TonB|nr:TonB family protein [Microscillaceae bacterium]
METKKNPAVDLRQKSPLFFNIGLVLSLALVMTAFEWKFYDNLEKVEIVGLENDFTAMEDIPIIPQKQLPPPVIKAPVIVEVPNEEPLEDIEATFEETELKETNTPVVKITPPVTDPIIDESKEDEPLVFAETQPSFGKGMEDFYKYVSKNIEYPKQARRMDIEGKVFVQFVVDKDGSLSEVKVVKGIGAGCDEEAIRVLKESPKWRPGKQRGRAVRVRMSLPIFFQIQ